jgi:hypothetical protein
MRIRRGDSPTDIGNRVLTAEVRLGRREFTSLDVLHRENVEGFLKKIKRLPHHKSHVCDAKNETASSPSNAGTGTGSAGSGRMGDGDAAEDGADEEHRRADLQ